MNLLLTSEVGTDDVLPNTLTSSGPSNDTSAPALTTKPSMRIAHKVAYVAPKPDKKRKTMSNLGRLALSKQ